MTPELWPVVVLDYVRIVLIEDILYEGKEEFEPTEEEVATAVANIEKTMKAVKASWNAPLQLAQLRECYVSGMTPHQTARLYCDRALYPNLYGSDWEEPHGGKD